MVRYLRYKDIGVIVFNDKNSPANLLSSKNLKQLASIVNNIIGKDPPLKAIFFLSKKRDIFIAGADIKELIKIDTKKEALEFCRRGQDLFNKIDLLHIPVIAIVNGACVGGGFELALACDYIVATENKKVRFGLPESKLGIVPGFGGPHRLTAKIGAKRAGLLIDNGRLLGLDEARRVGIVDRIITKPKKISDLKPLSKVFKKPVKPAYLPKEDFLERKRFSNKILGRPAKNALGAFLLIQNYKKTLLRRKGVNLQRRIKHCAIIGAGKMGRGIAYLISSNIDGDVGLCDIKKDAIVEAKRDIYIIYKEAVEKDLLYKKEAYLGFKRISFGITSFKDVEMVIECVPEDFVIKSQVFRDIEKELRRSSIIATNTSCISINKLAQSLEHPERFVGVHFFNPAYKMKLVEIIPSRFTRKANVDRLIKFLYDIKRIPILVKDSPGFLVNRILLPYLNEAIFMLQEGIPGKDIEDAMIKFGMPVGPLTLIREIGVDVYYKAAKILEENFKDRMRVPEINDDLTQSDIPKKRILKKEKIQYRLLQPMKREAMLCLREHIVDNMDLINLALYLGVGFPRTKSIWEL